VKFTTSEAAEITNGMVRGVEAFFRGADIDSRSVGADQLFIPVVADRDGHAFIGAAIDRGASVFLTSQSSGAQPEIDAIAGVSAVAVADTLDALTALGSAARDRMSAEVIGITGSVGKTSTKDLCAAVLAHGGSVVHASTKSFNNEMGVPLTLLNAPDDAAAVVVEMGARGLGHIAHLCCIARPTIGVVTMVGAVHTSEFGNLETVAQAKGELVESVPPNGHVVLNADSPAVAAMAARSVAPVLTYGIHEIADIRAEGIELDSQLQPSFTLHTPLGSAPVKLAVRGEHNISNALAAAAVGHLLGRTPAEIAGGLAKAGLSPWRMEVLQTSAGATVINDAYNANPMSMAAGLRALVSVPAKRRIAVLGVMAELGDLHDEGHQSVAKLAEELDVEVIAFQEDGYGPSPVSSIEAAIDALGPLGPDDAVLVKGSRVAELERLAAALTALDS